MVVASPVLAQTASHYDLSLPMLSDSAYDFGTTASVPAPSAPAAPSKTAVPDSYNFNSFRPTVHGYVAAGVATRGGHDFSGGVEMPLVPGKVDVAVGGDTGRLGAAYGGHFNYDSYYAALHLHPADGFDAYIGLQGGHLDIPTPPLPRAN